MFGKPCTCIPCSERIPSRQYSDRLIPVGADDVVAGPPRVVGADLEPGGIDQAVDLVLPSADDDAVGGDARRRRARPCRPG